MRIDFNIAQSERGKFQMACEAAIRNVGSGTKAATEEAAFAIMSESMSQVPIDTGTLISSAFIGVSKRTDIKSSNYGAILGYGNTTGLNNATASWTTETVPKEFMPFGDTTKTHTASIGLGSMEWLMAPATKINPKSGLPSSAYASIVHEDLGMPHPNGGKAKFLEDPIREWAAGRFSRTAMTYWKRAITWSNFTTERHKFFRTRTGTHSTAKLVRMRVHRYSYTITDRGIQRSNKGGSK